MRTKTSNRTPIARWLCPIAATALVVAGGCGSSVPHRRVSLAPTGASSSWNTVLPSPATEEFDEIRPGDLAYARRDSEMAMRHELPVNAVTDSWTTPDRPSLAQTRRLYLNNRPETVVYFRGQRERSAYRRYVN